LYYGIPPDWKVEIIPGLSPGQSHQFMYMCNFNDVAKVQFHVSGEIHPNFKIQVKNEPQKISSGWSIQSMPHYFNLVDALGIHQWLNKNIRNVMIPTANNTLGEANEIQIKYDKVFNEIAEAKKYCGRIS
jgi:hypothetical protein